MSSIIVLDSSDEEDEAPAKKSLLGPGIPATITPIIIKSRANVVKQLRPLRPKPETGAVTATSRSSPVTNAVAKSVVTSAALQSESILSKLLDTTVTLQANSPKTQLPALSKISVGHRLNNSERRTPTPPKQQQQLPAQELPQQLLLPHMRKRKTPTPPQRTLVTPPAVQQHIAGEANATLPMVASVQSMAAGSTPPLQLLATPPHTLNSNFNEQLMINPHLIHTNLPSSTTITVQTVTKNNNNNNSNKNNNIDNIYKIQLPSKRSVCNNTTNNSNAPSRVASPALKTSTIPITISSPNPDSLLKVSGGTINLAKKDEKPMRRIKPTTLLKHNDEAWLQRQRVPPVIPLNDDVAMELLPSTSSASNSPRPTYKRATTSTATTMSSPKARISPQTIIASPVMAPPVTTASKLCVDLTTYNNNNNNNTHGNSNSKSIISPSTNDPPKLNGEYSTKTKSNTTNVVTSPTLKKSTEQQSPNADGDTEAADAAAKAPLESEFEELIQACREADTSSDMERLIETKLLKYYHSVHTDFVKSRGFRKTVRTVTERIRTAPDLVYYNVKTIVDELKVRRKGKEVTPTNNDSAEEPTTISTGNKRTDDQIKKLNKALYILTKRIEKLEASEVDWDDDDSSYLQVERFKKRACQIYDKICDLTGESKNAHRLGKKPIQFRGTSYPQFNKTLQAYINRTKEFPDYYDVLRMLEHCNRQYSMGLANFEMKRIAHDAFTKVGKLLQLRRKTDLYETVTHYTANTPDPATTDPVLLAKLSENQKNQTKVSAVIEKYAREQDLTAEEHKEARLEKLKANAVGSSSIMGDNAEETDTADVLAATTEKVPEFDDDGDDDDEEDEEEEEEDDVDLEADVEKLTNGDELSDAESDAEEPGKLKNTEPKLETSIEAENQKDKNKEVTTVVTLKEKTATAIISETKETTVNTESVIRVTLPKECDNASTTKRLNANTDTTTNSSSFSNHSNKNISIIVNKNIMGRAKTGESSAATITTTTTSSTANTTNTITKTKATVIAAEHEKPIPNGELKMGLSTNTANVINVLDTSTTTATTTNRATTTATQQILAATTTTTTTKSHSPVAAISDGLPNFKIVSVTSLNEKAFKQSDENSKNSTTAIAAPPTTPTSKTTIKQISTTVKQRTVAEIVISDEES